MLLSVNIYFSATVFSTKSVQNMPKLSFSCIAKWVRITADLITYWNWNWIWIFSNLFSISILHFSCANSNVEATALYSDLDMNAQMNEETFHTKNQTMCEDKNDSTKTENMMLAVLCLDSWACSQLPSLVEICCIDKFLTFHCYCGNGYWFLVTL